MSVLRYDFKLQLHGGALAAMAVPALVPLVLNVERVPLEFAELFWPITGPLLLAALFSREWESGTAEVLLARPVSRLGLLSLRLVTALSLLSCAFLLGWAAFGLRGVPVPLHEVLAVSLPGTVAMGALGLFTGTASRSSPAGYLAPLAWWLIDFVSKGTYTGKLYLFGGPADEKWWLATLALGLVAATWLLLRRRDA